MAELEESSKKSNGTVDTEKFVKHCRMCRQHGLLVRYAQHRCQFRDCTCEKCNVIREQRTIMSRQMIHRRNENRQTTDEQNYKYTCQRCRNHGICVPKKDHVFTCPYLECQCELCAIAMERSDVEYKLRLNCLVNRRRSAKLKSCNVKQVPDNATLSKKTVNFKSNNDDADVINFLDCLPGCSKSGYQPTPPATDYFGSSKVDSSKPATLTSNDTFEHKQGASVKNPLICKPLPVKPSLPFNFDLWSKMPFLFNFREELASGNSSTQRSSLGSNNLQPSSFNASNSQSLFPQFTDANWSFSQLLNSQLSESQLTSPNLPLLQFANLQLSESQLAQLSTPQPTDTQLLAPQLTNSQLSTSQITDLQLSALKLRESQLSPPKSTPSNMPFFKLTTPDKFFLEHKPPNLSPSKDTPPNLFFLDHTPELASSLSPKTTVSSNHPQTIQLTSTMNTPTSDSDVFSPQKSHPIIFCLTLPTLSTFPLTDFNILGIPA